MLAAMAQPRRFSAATALRFLACVAVAALVVTPLVVAVVGGFRANQQLILRPIAWPDPFVTSNYGEIASSPRFWQQIFNSVMVMLLTTVLVLSLASAAAFVIARFQFRGREPLFNFFTLGLLFPLPVAILPLYLLLRQMGMVDTLWGMIVPQVAFGLPWNILLLRSFFLAIPRDLEDAAYVDGAGPLEFLLRDPAAAGAAGAGRGRGPDDGHELEQLLSAAGGPQQRKHLDAAARRHPVPGAVHGRLGAHPGLRLAGPHPGDRLLPRRRAPDRLRADGRLGEGVMAHHPRVASEPHGHLSCRP